MHRSFSLPGIKGKAQSESSSELRSRTPQLPRMSVLTSVKLPSLRRSESESSSSTTRKPLLLTLKLSSYSFLDSTLNDEASHPLYTINTVGMTTTIHRADPWDTSMKIADIKWPKAVPAKDKTKNSSDGVLVQLAGSRWKGGNSFLKQSSSTNGPCKFNIPYYSHSMKWRKQGTAYWCTSSPVKGPIAIFDPPVDHFPGQLKIYETLHDKYETGPMLVHKVTDSQEWMLVQTQDPSSSFPSDAPLNASRKWRKIAHREPLFDKTYPSSTLTPADLASTASTCQEQTASVMHEEPVYPRIYLCSKSMLSFSSDSDREDGNGPGTVSRNSSQNPSIQSPHSPLTENYSTTPAHTYIDPSFYLGEGIPPVPPLPALYIEQSRSLSPASTSIDSQRTRGLPVPPALVERSRSGAELSRTLDELHGSEIPLHNTGPADASLWKRHPSEPVMTRSRSVTRPLPRTPTARGTDVQTPVIRRIHSHNRISQTGVEKPWLSTSTTSSPPILTNSTIPRTPRHMRTLPPTPFDVAMGRSEGGVRLDKTSDSDEWVEVIDNEQDETNRPSFDHPPPAYSSLDLHCETWTR